MTGQPGLRMPSAGFDLRWSKIPRERLHPVDLYNMIDHVREGWQDDELFVTRRLQRLKWHLEELPDPFRMEALQQYGTVTRARIVKNTPWSAALASMRRIIWAWGQTTGAVEPRA